LCGKGFVEPHVGFPQVAQYLQIAQPDALASIEFPLQSLDSLILAFHDNTL
jgi:hypothetical protein